MVKKIWDWILFFIAITYLIIAFNGVFDGFDKKAMFGTDGFTLVMIAITFIGTIMSNSRLYMPIINKLILRLKNYDYRLCILLKTDNNNTDLKVYREIIEEKIFKNINMSKKVIEPIYARKSSCKYYYKNIHSHLALIFSDFNNELTLELDGGIRYDELNKIIESINYLFLDKSLKGIKNLERIELCINLERSRLKISNRFKVNKKFIINNILVDINIDESTSLKITKDNVFLDSITSSGFFGGYKELVKLLGEYILQGAD